MARQDPIDRVREPPRGLPHERRVGIPRRAYDPHPPALEIQHEERVVGHQPASSPYFRREEAGPGNRAPVRPPKGTPRRRPPCRRRSPSSSGTLATVLL